jgi:hypothetical protein
VNVVLYGLLLTDAGIKPSPPCPDDIDADISGTGISCNATYRTVHVRQFLGAAIVVVSLHAGLVPPFGMQWVLRTAPIIGEIESIEEIENITVNAFMNLF